MRQKLTTRLDARLLRSLRRIAREEERPLQSLVEEALTDLIDKRIRLKPRASVMAAYRLSIDRFESLYRKLADRVTRTADRL